MPQTHHKIRFRPVETGVRQTVLLGGSSDAKRMDTCLSVHVRSRNVRWGREHETRLSDGRHLNQVVGELTILSTAYGASEVSSSTLRYEPHSASRTTDYRVALVVPPEQFERLVALAGTRRLAYVDVTVPAVPASAPDGPGFHAKPYKDEYYVWDTDQILGIEAAKIEFDFDTPTAVSKPEPDKSVLTTPGFRAGLKQSHTGLARVVLNYPQGRWAGDGVQFDGRALQDETPTEEQIEEISTSTAGQAIRSLAESAYSQDGGSAAYRAASCAVEFVRANGIIYRARDVDSQRNRPRQRKVTIPSHLPMWLAPSIGTNDRAMGWASLEGLDRDALVSVCVQFYRTGVRCDWFEKMLVEALVGAEAYATVKTGMTTPQAWTGQPEILRTMLLTWLFGITRGGAAQVFCAALVNLVLWVGKVATLGLLAWITYSKDPRLEKWQSVVFLGALGLIAARWIGRYFTRLVVRWSKPFPNSNDGAFATDFGQALSALLHAYHSVCSDMTSTTAARDAMRFALSKGAGIDQVALAFLDRAVANKEFVWTRTDAISYSDVD
jgi:hypothetical protein